jgi:selT/selW/selH-like putative selenoprotein
VSLATELLVRWAPILRGLELRSGSKGRFEVTLDGQLVFSKAALDRFPEDGEVPRIFEKVLGPPAPWRSAKR